MHGTSHSAICRTRKPPAEIKVAGVLYQRVHDLLTYVGRETVFALVSGDRNRDIRQMSRPPDARLGPFESRALGRVETGMARLLSLDQVALLADLRLIALTFEGLPLLTQARHARSGREGVPQGKR
jgi:hypothetical protein